VARQSVARRGKLCPVRHLLAISMGCPGGVGAEVILASLRGDGVGEPFVVFGDLQLMRERAALLGIEPDRVVSASDPAQALTLADGVVAVVQVGAPLSLEGRRPGTSTREGGAAQLGYVEAACDAVARGDASALVTAPVSKEAIATSGAPGTKGFLGHTEWLGARLGAKETVMAFFAESLTITLATTHLPLSAVASALRAEEVASASYWTAWLCDRLKMDPALAVAVLALNPHAGEKGLLGHDEETTITPGIARARARLANEGRARALVGPLPAESAIRRTVRERAFAACVAMYHDQATIPSKLVAFGDAVNVTLGLPIVRTSVDHGTAYDLAGTGRAEANGMKAALALALRLGGDE
jgi:4-hydroxythreonine-4-phosphate dehydrogenase